MGVMHGSVNRKHLFTCKSLSCHVVRLASSPEVKYSYGLIHNSVSKNLCSYTANLFSGGKHNRYPDYIQRRSFWWRAYKMQDFDSRGLSVVRFSQQALREGLWFLFNVENPVVSHVTVDFFCINQNHDLFKP